MSGKPFLQSERTEAGDQTLVSGVRPITLRDRLIIIANRPPQPRRNPNAQQKPCDLGLFDDIARNQTDLLDYLADQQTKPTVKE